MKIILALFMMAFIIFIALVVFASKSRVGMPIGLVDGKLSPCSKNPNCVCSEFRDDTHHYIGPIVITKKSTKNHLSFIKDIVSEMGGVLYIEEKTYLAYQFSSPVFGFIDDFEIRHDSEANVYHIRSSSRVGRSDFGVNRKRVSLMKKTYSDREHKVDDK